MSKSDPTKNLKDIFEKSGLGMDDLGGMFSALFDKIVTCRACSQKNRLKASKKDPRCGKCGLPLVTA